MKSPNWQTMYFWSGLKSPVTTNSLEKSNCFTVVPKIERKMAKNGSLMI